MFPCAHAHGAAAQFLVAVDAELVELFRLAVALFGDVALGEREDGEEHGAENHSGDRGFILGEEVHDRGDQQHGGNENQSHWNFGLADVQVAGNFPCAVARLGKAQDEHGDGLHGEAPDHAERVERGQQVDVAAAENDGEQLQAHDQVDDAVAGAEAVVRLLEPTGEHAVFGHAIQNAVGAYDGSILRARQDEHAHQHHEAVKEQLQAGRARPDTWRCRR